MTGMTVKSLFFRTTKQASVISVTVNSRRLGAAASLVTIVAMSAVASCSSNEIPAPESWTSKPLSGPAASDGGTDAFVLEDIPPGPLCELTGAPKSQPGEVLVYSEEFDENTLAAVKWNIADGYRGHATILNTSAPANVVASNGTLKIVSERQPRESEHPFVSGMIDSLGRFARTYGKVEFRARFPYAAGVWYALWGRPWSQSFPEIDIEVVNRPGKAATELYFVNHWAAPPLPADDRRSFVMDDKHDVADFHTYTLNWKPGSFNWEKDGKKVFEAQARGVPDLPVYWIINGWVGGWPGTPDSTTPFPSSFEVDYMRVYRVDGLVADPVIKIVNPRATYSRADVIEVALANFDEVCAQVAMYDGETLLRTTSMLPLRLPLGRLGTGHHDFKFVATDGTRSVTSMLTTEIQ